MILEHAHLDVRPDQTTAFEAAFAEARGLISTMHGFRSLRLERSTSEPGTYLLLVEWDSVEDHTEGFRTSAAYSRWSELLHRFYDPMPVVRYYATVLTA